MFLKSLQIANKDKIIRDITFHAGLNLIVDETIKLTNDESGNNVGKTTVLSLIDFCLDGKSKYVYSDAENDKKINEIVRTFLMDNEIIITLVLTRNISDPHSSTIKIERNFLVRKKKIQTINSKQLTDEEFSKTLSDLIFPGVYGNYPTFKQLIAHNIRYRDLRLNNTLKILDRYTKDEEYEALYLYMLGCGRYDSSKKNELLAKINIENNFRKRLERESPRQVSEISLTYVIEEINELNKKKESFNINPDFQNDLDELDRVKQTINIISGKNSKLKLRRTIIIEAQNSLLNKHSNIDVGQLRHFYSQVEQQLDKVNKTFEELLQFHNAMLKEKSKFVGEALPQLNEEINSNEENLNQLLNQENLLTTKITKTPAFASLEIIIEQLNLAYEKKAKLEEKISQIKIVEDTIESLTKSLENIDMGIFSETFKTHLDEQLKKFNHYFSDISYQMYKEKFGLTTKIKEKDGKKVYEFYEFNASNFSSGKKQGEITCFDIAYTLFADQEKIPCLHFLLTDKKELMHDNQLTKIANIVNQNNIQFITSILKDKLPADLNDDNYIILSLSENNKLFRIENYDNLPYQFATE
ncbi:DUF2326 domain-containing protein [Orbus sturtevantii]|uniref:DUF2326 domain-containing protein n=1 Tax=Orbus sturtevantii TaxID=3074109 RepID=UPI00370D97D9